MGTAYAAESPMALPRSNAIRFDALSEDDLNSLLSYARDYAARVVRRYRWRGARHGVLPQGYQTSSIADEVLAQVLRHPCRLRPLHPSPFNRCNRSVSHDGTLGAKKALLKNIKRRIRRGVCRLVNRLHHLKENRVVRNEPDLRPCHHR